MSSTGSFQLDALGGPSPRQVADMLRAGSCPADRSFDRFFPKDLRVVSELYWTPLAVAMQAGRWFQELGIRSVIDIGAGPGKLCVAAALTSNCEFVGLEHRPRLVAVARSVARAFGVTDRVRFVRGALHDTPVPAADAYYLYNPFAENLFGPGNYLAEDVELSCDRYARDIVTAQDVFRRAPVGTVVLTYNGFGGCMPASYEHCRVERELPCELRLWRKLSPEDGGDPASSPAEVSDRRLLAGT